MDTPPGGLPAPQGEKLGGGRYMATSGSAEGPPAKSKIQVGRAATPNLYILLSTDLILKGNKGASVNIRPRAGPTKKFIKQKQKIRGAFSEVDFHDL
jgi:hypothetical protein